MEKIDKDDSAVDREGLGSDIVVGTTGCRRIRDFDACFRIGMLGANWFAFDVRRQGGQLTKEQLQ